MKLVIFTPAIKTSAIGRMASLVTRALAKLGHSVAVVRTEDMAHLQAEAHDFGTELVSWTDSGRVESLVRSADTLAYQVGDNYAFHRGCLEWLPRAPGVVSLHDFFLGHLFCGWAQNNKTEALATLRVWYGDEIAQLFFNFSGSDEFIEATKDTAPMTEWICSMAYAVVTHSSWGIQRVLDSCAGPVRIVPLAYNAPSAELKREAKRERPTAEFNVLTIGHVNPNKRVESVIQAIGNSAILRKCTTYQLVGQIVPPMAERLSALAESLNVKLLISGEVDSSTLLQAISHADTICCLRWPSLEAASASAIEAMLHGKPVIVTDTGFYAELPDDCVRKIQAHNEIEDLQKTLEWLCLNENDRRALGAVAERWASMTFSADNYATQLVNASLAAQQAAPILKATQSLAGMLWQWEASISLMTLSDTTDPLRLFNSYQESASIIS